MTAPWYFLSHETFLMKGNLPENILLSAKQRSHQRCPFGNFCSLHPHPFLAVSVRAARLWVPLPPVVHMAQKALRGEVPLLHSPECAELSWEIWSFSTRSQDRRSRSLMNCMPKEIHILPVAWLCAGTCFFNGDCKQTFWQDRILLGAIYVLLQLKFLGQMRPLFEKTQLYWGVMELSLILRCSWRKIIHAVFYQGSMKSPVRTLLRNSTAALCFFFCWQVCRF